jgi:hypothetical protein
VRSHGCLNSVALHPAGEELGGHTLRILQPGRIMEQRIDEPLADYAEA